MPRQLYLAAYDVRNPRRLARTTRYLKRYRVAGQKSVPELWITPAELRVISADLQALLDADADRLRLMLLDPRMRRYCLGQARTFEPGCFIVS